MHIAREPHFPPPTLLLCLPRAAHSRQRLASQKYRFKNSILSAIGDVVGKAARQQNADPEDLQKLAFETILSHDVGKEVVQRLCEDHLQASGYGAVRDSIAGVWNRLSAPDVVANSQGFPARRTLCAAVASEEVDFPVAKSFFGGNLKRETYAAAKKRRAAFMSEGNPESL